MGKKNVAHLLVQLPPLLRSFSDKPPLPQLGNAGVLNVRRDVRFLPVEETIALVVDKPMVSTE